MRSEFRYNRRHGRRTVAKWSRGGYRSRRAASSSTRSYARTTSYSSSRPMPSSVQPVPSLVPRESRPVYQARSEFSPLIAIFTLLLALFLLFLIALL